MVFKNERSKKICFGLLLACSIMFGVSFGVSSDANAASTWVNDPNFNYWTLTYNQGLAGNGISRYDNTATPPFNVLSRPSDYTNYLVGMTVNAIDVSGYTYDDYTTFYMDFQLRVVGGNGNYTYFPNVPPYTKFVVDSYSNSCYIDSSSNQLYYQYHCAVALPENHTPHYLYLDIGEPYSTGAPFSPVAGINKNDVSGTVVKLNYLGYGFDTQPNQTNQYLDVLSSQNQTIINQNQTIINQNAEYYEHEYDAIDNIENQSPSDIDTGTDTTTNLFTLLGYFLSSITNIGGNIDGNGCPLTLPFPSFAGGSRSVNPCSNHEKLPNDFWTVFRGLTLFLFFVPLCVKLISMIYGEIRSWTNG